MQVNNNNSYFLIIGNGRTGSTWLTTLLGEHSQIDSDFELKWQPKYSPASLHLVVDENSPSISNLLDQTLKGTSEVVGSKLILDPYRFLSQSDIDGLFGKIGSDIRCIYLTRNYFDLNMSFMRGAFNLTNQKFSSKSTLFQTLEAQRAENEKRQGLEVDLLQQKNRFIENLITLLFNDLVIQSQLANKNNNLIQVDYDYLFSSMPDIFGFVLNGNSDEQELVSLLNSPVIQKLSAVNVNKNTDTYISLYRLSNIFTAVMRKGLKGLLTLDDVFQVNEKQIVLINSNLIEALRFIECKDIKKIIENQLTD